MKRMGLPSLGFLAIAAAMATAPAVEADDFYKGKRITFTISTGPGGGHLVYGRVLTTHWPRFIPGNPDFVTKFMPGGGGIKATNYLYAAASKDGLDIGLVHTAVPFAPLYGLKGAKFDAREFNFIGSMDKAPGMCIAWHEANVDKWQDLFDKGLVVGGTGAGSSMETMPRLLNSLFGTKIKIISGYKGGNDVYLAMMRGEVQGRCGGLITSVKTTHPDWFPQKKVSVPIQISLKRSREFPDTPTVLEMAKDEKTKKVLKFALSYQEMDRPILVPPGVPASRVKLLRDAFNATLKDPKFLADAKRQKLSIDPSTGEEVTALVAETYAYPKDIIDAAVKAMRPKKK